MLKFKNRETKTGKEFIYQISMSCVHGGVQVEVDEVQEGPEPKYLRRRTVLLTPMDAAAFVHRTRISNGLSCRAVGHGIGMESEGSSLYVQTLAWCNVTGMEFVGAVAEAGLTIGYINMVVPVFVVDAMRLCVERMLESLMYHSTGDMEEEFG